MTPRPGRGGSFTAEILAELTPHTPPLACCRAAMVEGMALAGDGDKEAHPKRKRQFIVRRDPRDISMIYFYDPELQEYFAIPYRNTASPAAVSHSMVWPKRG